MFFFDFNSESMNDLSSALKASSCLVPRPAPIKAPSMEPCLDACLITTVSGTPFFIAPEMAPYAAP